MNKTIAITLALFALSVEIPTFSTPASAAGASRHVRMRHAVKHRTMRSGGGKMPASKNF